MPFKVTNPERPTPHSRSSSSSSHPMPPDRTSLRSFVSSSEHTAFSADPKISLDEDLPGYVDNGVLPPPEKGLPPLPQYEKQKSREDYDPYAGGRLRVAFHRHRLLRSLSADPGQSSSSSSHTYVYPLTTVDQLATALGPDNVPHSTEIETIPCSGVRIPFGPLKGLLAWRLVVRAPLTSATKGKGGGWNTKVKTDKRRSNHTSLNPSNPTSPPKSASFSDSPMLEKRLSSRSTTSLPMSYGRKFTSTPEPMPRPPIQGYASAMLTRHSAHIHSYSYSHPHPEVPLPVQHSVHDTHTLPFDAVTTNFILDTSLSYSIISRDTLITLGYPAHRFPAPAVSNPHSPHWNDNDAHTISVTLSIQNVLTKLRIARPGEASRLGVQFLHDAGVSVFFPRNGEGVGPVLYCECQFSVPSA